jgi:hypothetical protein
MAEEIAIIPNNIQEIAQFVPDVPDYIRAQQAQLNYNMVQDLRDEPNSPFTVQYNSIIQNIATNGDIILMNWFVDWFVLNHFVFYGELLIELLTRNNINLTHLLFERWDENIESLNTSFEVVGNHVFKNGDNLQLMQDIISFVANIQGANEARLIKNHLLHGALVYGRFNCTNYLVNNGAIEEINSELNDYDNFKHVIIYKALLGRNIQCLMLVMQNYRRGITIQEYMKILMFASKFSTAVILTLLLTRAPAFNIEPILSRLLISAIAFYNIDCIPVLEQRGGIINAAVVDSAEVVRNTNIYELIEVEEDAPDYDFSHFFDVLEDHRNFMLWHNNNINLVNNLLNNRGF